MRDLGVAWITATVFQLGLALGSAVAAILLLKPLSSPSRLVLIAGLAGAAGALVTPLLAQPTAKRNQGLQQTFSPILHAAVGLTAGGGIVEHPNIIPVYAASEADGAVFLAMRFVQGQDLSKLMRAEGRLDPIWALSILGGVAGALDAAHAEGLVHRDVKPHNVLLAAPNDAIGGPGDVRAVFLTDFGLAKRLDATRSIRSGGLPPTALQSRSKTGHWTAGPTSTPWGAPCSSASRGRFPSTGSPLTLPSRDPG
jgi:serine/threonine protein kinase